jgi:formylglycine-generating enzyme required for sulfatase activity
MTMLDKVKRVTGRLILLCAVVCVSISVYGQKSGGATSKSTGSADAVNIEMVFVEGGTFTMGTPDGLEAELPHEVTLGSFSIGKYEVTQGQWKAVMGSNPSNVKKGDNYPVEKISWNDAQEFIAKLNKLTGKTYRLPTEAEWEYAARGGKNSEFKYSGSDTVNHVAWHFDNSDRTTHPVGEKAPNTLGIYDMSGNVVEWCSDWHKIKYSLTEKNNPAGPETGSHRVVRGGSYSDAYINCRVAARQFVHPNYRWVNVGLRLVLVP